MSNRIASPASLPVVTTLGWVDTNSLKAGHVQKSNNDSVTLFQENGFYHVTGVPIIVDLSINDMTYKYADSLAPVNYSAHATVTFRDVRFARQALKKFGGQYRYRTTDTVIPAEARTR